MPGNSVTMSMRMRRLFASKQPAGFSASR